MGSAKLSDGGASVPATPRHLHLPDLRPQLSHWALSEKGAGSDPQLPAESIGARGVPMLT